MDTRKQLRNPLSSPSTSQVLAYAMGSTSGALQQRARFNVEVCGMPGTIEQEVRRLRKLDSDRGAIAKGNG